MNSLQHQSCRRTTARSGHSLIEMVLAVGVLALVLVGAQSAVMIAARATPAKDDANAQAASSAACLSAIADDLAVATSVSSTLPHALEFLVPDRTGDAVEDSIRYEWSGKPGEPLYRSLNGGAAEKVAASVNALEFTYDTQQSTPETTYAESDEVVVSTFDTATSTIARQVGRYSGDTYVRAQWFTPTLPADAVSWSITRVRFACRQGNTIDSVAQVQIRTARSGEPTGRVVSATTILETGMSATWRTQDISDIQCAGLRTDEAACLVLQQTSGNDYFEILVQRSKAADSYHLSSINGGSSWAKPTESMVFTAWGRVVRPTTPAAITVLNKVGYTIQVGGENSPAAAGAWGVLNRPTLSAGPPAVEEDPIPAQIPVELK